MKYLAMAFGTFLAVVLVFSNATAQQETEGQTGSTAAADVEHGRYIVTRVAMCFECHSTRDAQGNIVPGTMFMGGALPVQPPWPVDWALRAPRIAGLPGYTEESGVRLLTEGAIGRDGVRLRPPMPRFRMAPQDAAAVVAYLKSL